MKFPRQTTAWVREHLIQNREIALLDVREEGVFAQAHPLFAASLPYSQIELDVLDRIPRKDVPVILYDDGEGLAERSFTQLSKLGYTNLALLDGGLSGWRDAGGEIFQDVNTPSKAFGELVEAQKHTPSLSAQEVKRLLDDHADMVILDARRFDEYATMNIPGGISVPGGELVYRVSELAPDKDTTVIVNCAGRTRSLIGAQSLINAGISNKVFALRNGTIGWTLAGQDLENKQSRRFAIVREAPQAIALNARAVADKAGVKRISGEQLAAVLSDASRTTYGFDVRMPEEYAAGHRQGFRSAPGGQLVQETDMFAPVRGARIVLMDDTGVRANMTASWLAQMNWDVSVVDEDVRSGALEDGARQPKHASLPQADLIGASSLKHLLDSGSVALFDLSPSAGYRKAHIEGAWFALRSMLREALNSVADAKTVVLTSEDGIVAHFAADDLRAEGVLVRVLNGGNRAWRTSGFPLEHCGQFASPPVDRYRRPYEGTDNPTEAMQAYLDWEYGLVEQLRRDATHGFRVI